MELKTEQYIEAVKAKYPSLDMKQVIELIRAEALLTIAENGISVYINDFDSIPVELKGSIGICSQ